MKNSLNQKHHVRRAAWSDAQVERMIRMRRDGFSLEAVAAAFHTTKQAITNAIQTHNNKIARQAAREAAAKDKPVKKTRHEIVEYLRAARYLIGEIDGHVSYKGEEIDDAALLCLANYERGRCRLPPFTITEARRARKTDVFGFPLYGRNDNSGERLRGVA